MKIVISGDCFASFTSGFPVRGMSLELVRQNPDTEFQIYYTRRETPEMLREFYDELHAFPNVEVRYFKDGRKAIGIKRLLGLKYLNLDSDVDCFLNPGYPEWIAGYKGVNIGSQADLSTLKGVSTNRYAWFFKHWGRLRSRFTFPKFTKVVCISKFTENDLHGFFPDLDVKTQVVYNGIDTFWFEHMPDYYRPSLEIKAPYFIWWGVVSRRKNIRNLISAYRNAKLRKPTLPKLLIIGRVESYMQEILREFDGNDIIHMPFQDNDTLKYLVEHSKGLIFPSFYEGFGLPVIEAFSQGVPVACSDVTSLPEIANGHAILFNPNDLKAIEEAILRLNAVCADRELLKEYARRFTYEQAAREYMDLIKQELK